MRRKKKKGKGRIYDWKKKLDDKKKEKGTAELEIKEDNREMKGNNNE